MGYFWALMSVLLVSFAQLIMKWAMVALPPVELEGKLIQTLLHFPPGALALIVGLCAYVCSMGCWFLALRRVALSKAYPLLSLSYVLVWAAAIWLPWLDEAFSLAKLLGVGGIFSGLLLVCLPARKS